MPAPVTVDDLHKSFGATRAVNGASWSADGGAVTCVLGPNGAGKTTTIECLEGLQRPDGGAVHVLGVDPWGASPGHRARVGVMLQDGGLPQSVSPRRLLDHLARMHAGPLDADFLVPTLGIDEFAETPVRQLSGGQRQRLGLAAALLARPDVAFLDEPSAGLDPHARREVWSLVRATADRGACVVVTTHSFEEAQRLADRVVIMHRGRVVAQGTPSEVGGEAGLEAAYFSLTEVEPR